jgi:hypothetical protein
MSSQTYDSKPIPPMQEVDLNDDQWQEVVQTRLPSNLEAQARQLKAWSRQREVRSVSDLLRALLVLACCRYSWRDTFACGRCSRAWGSSVSGHGANGWISRERGSAGGFANCWQCIRRRDGCQRARDGCC